MNHQRAAEIQVVLEGVPLPAPRERLVRYAEAQDARAAEELRSLLPDREFTSLDEVGEALAPVQPVRVEVEPLPKSESGAPPGGGDYVRPFAESGAVRDDAPPSNPPQRVIEKQAATQKKQQARQRS